MDFNRRIALASAGALATTSLLASLPAAAQSADDTAAVQAVESLRIAMLKADRAAFERLCAPQLSYGHSAGKIETRAEFIAASTSGKSSWTSLNFDKRSIQMVGNNAIGRFMLTGQTLSAGKTTDINIGILTVWVKQGGNWKLLARQAYRV